MTSVKFIAAGVRLELPSGQTAKFVRWCVRPVKRGDVAQGTERIAVVRIDGCQDDTEFSERFMSRVSICRQ